MGIMSTIDRDGLAIRVSIDCAEDLEFVPQAISACKRLSIPDVFGVILDLRALEMFHDHLEPLALLLARGLSFDWPIALVANLSGYSISCAIALQASSGSPNIQVFRTPDDADGWLRDRQRNALPHG